MITIRPVLAVDAGSLFPLIYQTPVTNTLLWDGPTSQDEFRQSLEEREALTALGEQHNFTIEEAASRKPVGMISIRPDSSGSSGEIGLWIGETYHGRGYGTRAVREIVAYGFDRLSLSKAEACVFTGNFASRRIFEKNGFSLERTILHAVTKRGSPVDEWLFGLPRPEYDSWRAAVLHLCTRSAWRDALESGSYHPASLQSEEFIHCSRPQQILDVANRYYRGASDLICLWIEMERLQPEVRWEPGDGDEFPHVYGPINLDAVGAVIPFPPDAGGRFANFPRK
jgi:uncharacterized protein (DUF952 family)/RimJ/RimL family protein N-acetyltransferase